MELVKKGRIYCPHGEHEWEVNSFMTPHAMLLKNGVIRIYGGVRDKEGISRIKYIDVAEDNPRNILKIANTPLLNIGKPGCFDDNGVILGDILRIGKKMYMYYVGFQHVQKVKFFAFTGLAISEDNGEHFERYSETPILDRTNNGRFGRCIHTVLYNGNIFRCYYAVINDWKTINGIPYPIYNIWYTESYDGIHFPHNDDKMIVDVNNDEYRIGRPKVYMTKTGYEMYYTRDTVNKEYLAGYAVSEDGIHWKRQDEVLSLYKSESGWDSEMACYPVIYRNGSFNYMFYNGNGMGREGVGYALLKNSNL